MKQQPDYGPALLNLATVLRRDLGDVNGAAQRYRDYLALDPTAPDADSVKAILISLEPKPAAVAATPVAPPTTNPVVTNVVKTPTVVPATPSPVKSNPPALVVKPVAAPAVSNAEVVRLPPEPVFRASPPTNADASPPAALASSQTPSVGATTPAAPIAEPVKDTPEKRGFLSRLNPFRNNRKPGPQAVEVSPATPAAANAVELAGNETAGSFPRYPYRLPELPVAGNRGEAEAALARGREAERDGKQALAVEAYHQAVQADSSYFEAQYHLALAHYTARDYPAALSAWENALAIQSDSADARYNFALALKSAGYALDAAAELEKILAANPKDVRAHLILGNLCAEQLQDKRRARVHYQRILELDSRHPQATAIRYWLVANPG